MMKKIVSILLLFLLFIVGCGKDKYSDVKIDISEIENASKELNKRVK